MASFLPSFSIPKRKKTPEQLVSSAKTALDLILQSDVHMQSNANTISIQTKLAASQTLEKRLLQMKIVLYGVGEGEAAASGAASGDVDDEKVLELAVAMKVERLLILLINNFIKIPFEARKDIAFICNGLIRRNTDNFVNYIVENFSIVEQLVSYYSSPDLALNSGLILRELSMQAPVQSRMLDSGLMWIFFENYVHLPNFDVSADAFNTLRDVLVEGGSRNKQFTSQFIWDNYDTLFSKYDILLRSDNYVTRRRSLKMLSEILLEKQNFKIMMKYIALKDNLKTIMTALRDKSANIQFEAFHMFKVFVANPSKPPEIISILMMNKVKLITYLNTFQSDRTDTQFNEEKRILIETLTHLDDFQPQQLQQQTLSSSSSFSSAQVESLTAPVAALSISNNKSNINNSGNGSAL